MDVVSVTPENMLKKLDDIVSHLIGQEDYWCTKEAQILKHQLELYFEMKKQEDV